MRSNIEGLRCFIYYINKTRGLQLQIAMWCVQVRTLAQCRGMSKLKKRSQHGFIERSIHSSLVQINLLTEPEERLVNFTDDMSQVLRR